MELTYQPITPEDVEKIFAFIKGLVEQYEDMKSIDSDEVFRWCRKKIEKTSSDYCKIVCNKENVGYIALHREEETEWEIDDFYLFPEFRGKGIGTEVLSKIKEQASKEGKSLLLYVFVKNTGAIKLYRKMGFEVTDEVSKTRLIMQWNPKK